MRRSEFGVTVLIEAEDYFRPLHENRAPDQVRIFQHQIDRFLFRARKRALLPHRTPCADVIEEVISFDVLLEERARRRLLVDVDLLQVQIGLGQETPGVPARGSGRLRVEDRTAHERRIIDSRLSIKHCRLSCDWVVEGVSGSLESSISRQSPNRQSPRSVANADR